jgi:hypothetical protein
MKRPFLLVTITAALAVAAFSQTTPAPKKKYPVGGSYPSGANVKVVPDLDKRLAKFKAVQMPFNTAGLTAREVKLVNKLVEASRMIDSIYWRQSDPDGLTLLQQLQGSKDELGKKIHRFLFINGSRFDLIRENEPFILGIKRDPARGLYPPGTTAESLEKYVAAHPEKKEEIYSSTTVVRARGDELNGIPYHNAYSTFLGPAAKSLREAAALSDDKAFADFLRARADSLLNDDYYPSDLLWVDLKNPKFDIIFAPYETYLDDILGVKGSYGAAVMIRNEAESKKLAMFQQYVPDIQESLPLAKEDKPDKHGQPTPMEVMDTPYRAGDLLHGYQAVADNLPNDPRIHEKKGTKKIFFKNFMDARVNYVILPLARRMMRADQAAKASADGYMAATLMHEICHGLGPAFSRTSAGQVPIREAVGPTFAALEEAKADVTGMFGLDWLLEHNILPKKRREEFYASYLAGILRTARFGVAEAHGRAEMMEFNYLTEQGAITSEKPAGGKPWQLHYVVNFDKMPAALASLARELLEIEATGDRKRAEAWFAKYDQMPMDMKVALDHVTDVPVDIYPVTSFSEYVK